MNRSLGGLAVVVAVMAGCGAGAVPVDTRDVAAMPRAPFVAERVALADGARAVAVWSTPEGGGVVALADGSFAAVDARGQLAPQDWTPGEAAGPMDRPVARFADRGAGEAVALVPGGALVVQHGLVRHAALPAMLSAPRAFALFGAEVLWATGDGVYVSDAARWVRLDDGGPVRDAAEAIGLGVRDDWREAWVRRGEQVRRVRYRPTATGGSDVVWSDPLEGSSVGPVRAIAAMGDGRGVIAGDRGVAVVAPAGVVRFLAGDGTRGPVAAAGGGGWAWVVWDTAVLRTDGEHWESLARDAAFTRGTTIAVDADTGAAALVVDAAGALSRIQAQETLPLSGLLDGASVFDTALELEALPVRTDGLQQVSFQLDDRAPFVRTGAPWGWAEDGSRARDVALPFGDHSVAVTATYADGRTLTRRVRFRYVSPVAGAPSYARDIAPLFTARCARCHANGVARDINSYDALRAQSVLVRAAVRERRMPPDLALDDASIALLTAWVDGAAPP